MKKLKFHESYLYVTIDIAKAQGWKHYHITLESGDYERHFLTLITSNSSHKWIFFVAPRGADAFRIIKKYNKHLKISTRLVIAKQNAVSKDARAVFAQAKPCETIGMAKIDGVTHIKNSL